MGVYQILYNRDMKLRLQENIILRFWSWYYSTATKGILRGWRNSIIFVREYYSISLLLRTLFSPWRRDITKYRRGFSVKNFLETLSFNLISRSLGFSIRLFTIVIGLISFLGVIIIGAIIFITWLILPIILLFLFIIGLLLLMS